VRTDDGQTHEQKTKRAAATDQMEGGDGKQANKASQATLSSFLAYYCLLAATTRHLQLFEYCIHVRIATAKPLDNNK